MWRKMPIPQPSKKSKESGVKGSVAFFKESVQLGCVSQDSHPRKSTPRQEGNLGSNRTVKFSKGTWHHKKIGKERVHREASFKSVDLTNAIRALPDLKTKRCTKKDAPAQKHGTWRNMSASSNIRIKLRFYTPIEVRAKPAPTSKSPEEQEIVVDSGACTS